MGIHRFGVKRAPKFCVKFLLVDGFNMFHLFIGEIVWDDMVSPISLCETCLFYCLSTILGMIG